MTDKDLSIDAAADALNEMFAGDDAEELDTEAPVEDDDDEEDRDEDAAEAEESEEADDKDEDEADEPELHTVKVNGKEFQVTLDELRKSYQLDKHITEKSERVSAKEREAAEALEARNEQRERLKAAYAEWAIQEQAEPDWSQYLQQGYSAEQVMAAQYQWNQRKAKSDEAREAYRALQREQEEEIQAANEARAKEEMGRIIDAIPEWADKSVAVKEVADLTSASAKYYGMSEEDLKSVNSAPQILILRDAIRYRKMQEENPVAEKRVSESGKSLRPGSKATAKQRAGKKQTENLARFQKNPSKENAAIALDGLLGF